MTTARELRYLRDLHAVDAADRLSRISLGLVEGSLTFEQDGRRMVCHTGRIVKFALHAEEGSETGKCIIELTWRRPLEVHIGRRNANGSRADRNGGRAERSDRNGR